MKLAITSLISWSLILKIGQAEDATNRGLLGVPGFVVLTESTMGSKVAWRVFEKDDDPELQDSDENTMQFVDASDYTDGETRINLEEGGEYCLRVYKGEGEEFGSSHGSNTVEVVWFDGLKQFGVKNSPHIVVSSFPLQEVKCFTAKVDLMKKYPPSLVSCSAEEAVVVGWAVGPLDALTAKDVADEAWAVSNASGLEGEHDGLRDAFRHCYASCRLSQEIGIEQALEVGDIHESCYFHGTQPRDMDLYNNRVGASVGERTTEASECESECLDAVNNGETQNQLSLRYLRGFH